MSPKRPDQLSFFQVPQQQRFTATVWAAISSGKSQPSISGKGDGVNIILYNVVPCAVGDVENLFPTRHIPKPAQPSPKYPLSVARNSQAAIKMVILEF